MARADIHFHLLPGVDDGPGTMEESVDLAVEEAFYGRLSLDETVERIADETDGRL